MKRTRRDGCFFRNGWWWIDYVDAGGKRHRRKAALTHEVAKLMYKDTVTAIKKGALLGLIETNMSVRDFVTNVWLPHVIGRLDPTWAKNIRVTLDSQVLPRFGDTKSPGGSENRSTPGPSPGWRRWRPARLTKSCGF